MSLLTKNWRFAVNSALLHHESTHSNRMGQQLTHAMPCPLCQRMQAMTSPTPYYVINAVWMRLHTTVLARILHKKAFVALCNQCVVSRYWRCSWHETCRGAKTVPRGGILRWKCCAWPHLNIWPIFYGNPFWRVVQLTYSETNARIRVWLTMTGTIWVLRLLLWPVCSCLGWVLP